MIESAPGQVLFRLLGPLEAWTGQDWAKIGAAKRRSVLAALLLRLGEPVSTDALIDEVWPGGAPAKAGNLLSGYVHHLRRLIGDPDGKVLVTRAPGYQMVLRPGQLDADRFARLVIAGRQALAEGRPQQAMDLLSDALGLWRGPALADVPATRLVDLEADRLEEARIEAAELRARALLACGRPAEVVTELRRLLAGRPLWEHLWALLIRALYGDGRQAEALETYEQARTTISEELGVDPGTELKQLYQQILNEEPPDPPVARPAVATGPPPASPAAPGSPAAPAPPVPAQLPADIGDFTGRDGEVAQLRGLLAAPEGDASPGAVRVALVVGSGGVGKTTFAVHAAHLLTAGFPDGQLYVNLLGATQPVDPAEVLARFLRDLGVAGTQIPVGEDERAAYYRSMLAGKRMLIVLDDARDAPQVWPLLPGSASCAVLITARRRMPEVPGLKVVELEDLPLAEARTLFDLVVGRERALAEPDAAEDVLAACAGLPLAIRIAGARLAARGSWTVRALADRLADERRRLDELRVGNLAVRASFEVSFASLPGPAVPGGVDPAWAFQMLGLWTGPSISLSAASALLAEAEDAVADALDVLVDAHLLESPASDRYRFHDLLRVYAAERALREEAERDRLAAINRLVTWYLHTTDATAAIISAHHARVPLDPPPAGVFPLSFGSLEEVLAWCERERLGLIAATRLAAASGLHDIGWKLPAAAMSFYYRRSHWGDWVTTHQIGLASARALGDRSAEAWMLNLLGMAHGVQHMAESVGCFEQALAIYRELGDERGEARAAANVAQAFVDLRRYDDALTASQRSLVIQRQQGNRYLEAVTLGILGRACRELSRFTEAINHLEAALAIFRELRQEHGEADSLTDLADALLCLDQVNDAVARLRESLVKRQSIGDMYGEALTLRLLGIALDRLGERAEANVSLTGAVRLFTELGDREQAAAASATLAAIMKPAG